VIIADFGLSLPRESEVITRDSGFSDRIYRIYRIPDLKNETGRPGEWETRGVFFHSEFVPAREKGICFY
jgi:hypothetical protein